MSTSTEDTQRAFLEIEQCAVHGNRCPENDLLGHGAVPALARDGKVRTFISGRNFRQVEILVGPHAGKKTMADPTGAKPWKTIDKNGTRTARGHKAHRPPPGQRRAPSPPRPLTKDELAR